MNVLATAAMHFPSGQPSPPPSAPEQPYTLTMSAGNPITVATPNKLLAAEAEIPSGGDSLVTAVLVPTHESITPPPVVPHAVDALPRGSVVIRGAVTAVPTSGHRQEAAIPAIAAAEVAEQVRAFVAVYIGTPGGGPGVIGLVGCATP